MPDSPSFDEARRQLDTALNNFAKPPVATMPATSTALPAPSAPLPDPLRTLTRLVVGTALLGLDELARRAPEWEREAASQMTAGPEQALQSPPIQVSPSPSDATAARQALIGWVFATQEQLRLDPNPGRWLQRASGHAAETATVFVRESLGGLLGNPGRRPAMDPDLARWIAIGQAEEQHSRMLAQIALRDIVHEVIGGLANEPALQDLVETQSTSLATEVIEEVRERTVSGDIAAEGFVRRLLRWPQRKLPPSLAPGPANPREPLAPGETEPVR
jgi:hypothetical protein